MLITMIIQWDDCDLNVNNNEDAADDRVSTLGRLLLTLTSSNRMQVHQTLGEHIASSPFSCILIKTRNLMLR